MKKVLPVLCAVLVLGLLPLPAQEIHEERTVVNVTVPVRVFAGDKFVSDLKLEDFEVFEDGVPQKVEAVYLVHGTAVERRDEVSRFAPETSRHFYLFFEVTDYTAEIARALDEFVENVVQPGDTVSVVTPVRTYVMRMKALEVQSRPHIAEQLKGILRSDCLAGSAEYRSIIADLEDIARQLARAIVDFENTAQLPGVNELQNLAFRTADFRPEQLLMQYAASLSGLDAIRKLDVAKLVRFAGLLRREEGQKYVFLFYEREFLPEVEPRLLEPFLNLSQENPEVQHAAASIFEFYQRYNAFDLEKLKQSYANASIAIHFLFIDEPRRQVPGLKFREKSEDVYSAFREMATATGGFFGASANPQALLRSAVDSAENYYLLYYTPQNPQKDGRFRSITVRVKGGDFRVTNRQGYIAD